MAKRGRRRGLKNLSRREKEIISNVHAFFVEEKRRQRKIHASDVARRTADACGVSRRTVFNAIRQTLEEQYPSSSKGEEKRGRPVIALDEFMEWAIRMQMRDFFSKKKNATAEKVLAACVANVRDCPAMSIEV